MSDHDKRTALHVLSNLSGALGGPASIKDSGAREDFGTGSVRDLGTGKGSYELLQEFGIHAVAMQLERGIAKYGTRNWEKGQPVSRYLQSARRHLSAYSMGLRDEPHLSAAAWNVLCMIDTIARIETGQLPKSLDDMPAPLDPETAARVVAVLKTL